MCLDIKEQLRGIGFSFHHVDPRHQSQFSRLVSKHLCPLPMEPPHLSWLLNTFFCNVALETLSGRQQSDSSLTACLCVAWVSVLAVQFRRHCHVMVILVTTLWIVSTSVHGYIIQIWHPWLTRLYKSLVFYIKPSLLFWHGMFQVPTLFPPASPSFVVIDNTKEFCVSCLLGQRSVRVLPSQAFIIQVVSLKFRCMYFIKYSRIWNCHKIGFEPKKNQQ